MDEPSTPEPLPTGPALIRTGTLLGEIYESNARELGMTPQQARLLFIAAEAPSNMLGLGTSAGLSKSTMTSLVDRMEELDLLVRTPDPQDRRRLVVAATAHGRAVSSAFEDSMRKSIGALIEPLRPSDRAELARILSTVLAHAEALIPSE